MNDPIPGHIYTVRCALKVQLCKERCLEGDTSGNPVVPVTREITNGTRLEHRHYDPLSGSAFMIAPTGEGLRVPASYLIPWT